ncbi:MAG TPA: hypothetical protein DEA08_18855, partial [Planctomycetes bacterium]|nr:hypothetical protein [Planctomycetota bacterium]
MSARGPGSELPLPPDVRAALDAIAADAPPAARIARLVDLVEGELARLLLAPLRPWGETIGEALLDEPGGR